MQQSLFSNILVINNHWTSAMRQSLRIFLGGVGLLLATAARAEILNKDLAVCAEGPSADLSIKSCTALIQSPTQQPARLRDLYAARGERYREDGQFDRAVADFDQAIKLATDKRIVSMLLDGRGEARQAAREYDLAIADFDQAIKLDPENGFALVSRADAYQAKGLSDRASRDFDRAKQLALNPAVGRMLLFRGSLLIQRNLFGLAVVYFDRAIKLTPNDGIAYARRGFAYKVSGQYDRAIDDFDQALPLTKDRSFLANLLYERGSSYMMKGQYDRAIRDIDQGIEYNRTSMGLSFRGNAYRKKGEYGRAIRDYDEALGLAPRTPAILFARSLAKQDRGDLAGASADRAAATAIDPDIADKMVKQRMAP